MAAGEDWHLDPPPLVSFSFRNGLLGSMSRDDYGREMEGHQGSSFVIFICLQIEVNISTRYRYSVYTNATLLHRRLIYILVFYIIDSEDRREK